MDNKLFTYRFNSDHLMNINYENDKIVLQTLGQDLSKV